MKTRGDQLFGTLDLLVLKTLEQGSMHGWGITLHIEEISDALLRVEEGSLYPALYRMEQEGWISAEWGVSENNRRALLPSDAAREKAARSRAGAVGEDYGRGGGGAGI